MDQMALLKKIEAKVEEMDKKLNEVIKEIKIRKLRDIHFKILDLLKDGWVSTSELAKMLNFRQEYISRKVADLKAMDMIDERRIKRTIKYRVKS